MAFPNAVVRWTFTDYQGSPVTTYTVPMNPNAGGLPEFHKQIQYQNTAAPGGNVLMFEGPDQPPKTTVSGTILEEAHYQAFRSWYLKRRPVQIQDDLGNTWIVYITDLTFTRQRSAIYPWKMTFQMNYVVFSYTDA